MRNEIDESYALRDKEDPIIGNTSNIKGTCYMYTVVHIIIKYENESSWTQAQYRFLCYVLVS